MAVPAATTSIAGIRPSWVTFSNRHYDPQRGHALYNEYLDEMEHAEALGYDGLGVNEHHQNAYGTMPSPNLMAAALIRRTSRAKIAILGNAIPLRDHPLRVAEEVAMLDVMSGGRIISGFVRGIGCEYLSLGINPTYSRERFYEAHELILRAWTEDGPFCFEGKHYQVRYANIWPRPLQQPHPPIWLPSQGSTETIRWGAQRRYPFISVFTSYAQTKRLLDEYKAAAEAAGYTAQPEQIGFALPTYVAETDARAREEAKPHMLWLFRRGLKIPPQLPAAARVHHGRVAAQISRRRLAPAGRSRASRSSRRAATSSSAAPRPSPIGSRRSARSSASACSSAAAAPATCRTTRR